MVDGAHPALDVKITDEKGQAWLGWEAFFGYFIYPYRDSVYNIEKTCKIAIIETSRTHVARAPLTYQLHSTPHFDHHFTAPPLNKNCVCAALIMQAATLEESRNISGHADTTFRGYSSAQVEEYASRRGGYPQRLIDEIVHLHTSTGGTLGTLLDLGTRMMGQSLQPFRTTAD
jgi:hypothetical protein